MPAYLVQLKPELSGQYLMDGANTHVVFAADAAEARSAVEARYNNDVDAIWGDSAVVDVTEIVADADFEDWTLRLSLYAPGSREPLVSVDAVGVGGDGVDNIAATAVTALNATSPIANASYEGTGNVLTVAGAADNLGDHTLDVQWIPPWGAARFTPFEGSITDGGTAGSAVTVALPADAPTIPNHVASLRTR